MHVLWLVFYQKGRNEDDKKLGPAARPPPGRPQVRRDQDLFSCLQPTLCHSKQVSVFLVQAYVKYKKY
jgi:hypothetical protein